MAAVRDATGTDQPDLQQRLIDQVYDTLGLPDGLSDEKRLARVKAAIAILEGIKPRDEIEGMLATQMVATHNAAMECLRRAMVPAQTFPGRDQSFKYAAKLLSIYSRQIETLNKHRGKGQQKVTVEYVHVESGGQAIVGHVETSGGAAKRKRRKKSEPDAVSHDPGETIDMDLSDLDLNAAKSTKRRKP
jgi:hypothetical protein